MSLKNFVVKHGLTVGNATIDATSGNLAVNNANLGNLAVANFFSGNANALFNIQGGNVVGQVGNALVAGTVYTNAQPNITSVGTLTGLTVNGISNFGPNANVKITGGTSGQFLQTDGTGNLSWQTIVTSGVSNGTSNISIPVADGNVNTSVGGVANVFVVTSTGANVTGTLNASGNANVGNLGTGGLIVATGNIDGGNFNTTGVVSATGNITGGNLSTAGVLSVTGNANVGNLGAAAGVFTANVSAANLSTTGVLSVTGNANVGNLGAATGVFTANVDAANLNTVGAVVATGNVSGGNLTTVGVVTATGNVSGGNLTTTGLVSATGNVNGGNVNATGKVVASTLESNVANGTAPLVVASSTLVTNLNADLLDGYNSDVAATANTVVIRDANANISGNNISGTLSTAAQPNITSVGTLSSLAVTGNIDASANINVDTVVGKTGSINILASGDNNSVYLKPTGTGTVDAWNKIISNVALPVAATDVATKGYVDSVAEGLHVHASVAAATPNTLASISGGTITYNNGTAGVGATLTTTGTFATIDGVNIATVGTRILVKDEANAAHNGIYVFTSSTVLTRATDYDTAGEIQAGDFTFVSGGTLYNSTGWVQEDEVTTIGTDPIVWTQFSGAGTYLAGTGLTLTGDTFSISNTTVTAASYGSGDAVATFTVNAQGQLTAASNVAIAANAANLTGSVLSSNIVTSSLTTVGTLGSLSVTGNVSAGNISATDITGTTLGGTLTTAAQPNITSVGTLTSLSVTGNANVGNIGAAAGVFTANVSAGNLSSAGVLSVTGNANVGNLGTAGAITATGNIAGGNISTVGALSVTGNANVGNLGATNGVFTANVDAGNLSSLGTLSVTGNANVGNLGTAGSIAATGNVSGGNLTTVGAVTATGTVTGGNLSTAGTLSVTGNANVGNIGAESGVFSANVSVTGNLSGGNISTAGVLSVTGNANVGNLGTAGVITATGTITGGNLSTAGTLSVTGNANVGNLGTAGSIIATGNIDAGNLSSLGTLSVTGNANVGNIGGTGATFTTLAGNLTTAAQPNITSVGTLTGLDVNGNITAVNITANTGIFTGNAAGLTNIPAGNISGQVANALVAGTVYTNAQPNITSVGTLSSLDVSGNGVFGNVYANSGTIGANLLTGTLTTAAQPNITSVGTLSNLTTSGNVVVGGNVKVQVGITSNRANVAVSSTPTKIDEFAPGDWRTAKYVISASGDDGYQSVETLLVHDGLDAYITVYGSICSNVSSDLIELSANINGVSGNVTVYASSASDNCYVNLVTSYIKT
jgi:hypothetical protein